MHCIVPDIRMTGFLASGYELVWYICDCQRLVGYYSSGGTTAKPHEKRNLGDFHVQSFVSYTKSDDIGSGGRRLQHEGSMQMQPEIFREVHVGTYISLSHFIRSLEREGHDCSCWSRDRGISQQSLQDYY